MICINIFRVCSFLKAVRYLFISNTHTYGTIILRIVPDQTCLLFLSKRQLFFFTYALLSCH